MRSLFLLTILSTVAILRISSVVSTPCIKNGKVVELRPYGVPGETPQFVRHLRCKNNESEHVKHKNLYPEFKKYKNGGSLLAMVSGDRDLISTETWEVWRKSGVGHLLVISGQQLAILTMIILLIFVPIERKFPFFAARYALSRWNGIIILPLIWGYVFWTGSDGATIRSGMMLSVVFVYRALYLRFALWQWFLLTILLIVIAFPGILVDAGFHLSLFAVLGIIIANKNFHSKNIVTKWYVTTLGATLGVLPIAAFYFGEFSLFGWLASLTAVPLMILLLPLVSVATFLTSIKSNYLGSIILAISDKSITLFEKLILIPISNHKLSMLSFPINGTLGLVILIVTAVISFKLCKIKKYRETLVVICSSILILISLPKIFWFLTKKPNTLQWTTISVGQGESLLFRFPTGESMLIDGGGLIFNKFDPGESLVVPTLNSLGVNRIDLLIASHQDYDHLKGLFAVIKRKRVRKIWINEYPENSKLLESFIAEAKNRNIPIEINPNSKINFGDVKIETIRGIGKYDSTNNRSMVLKVTYGKYSFLLTADIETPREKGILLSKSNIDVDVLKIAHHGSKTSSSIDFIRATTPKLAIISAGYKNKYHHPHPSIMQRLKELRIPYLLTAINGSIQIETDGETLETRCFDVYTRRWLICN